MISARAAVTREAGQPLVLENVSITEPADNEILVKIHSTGICHTDLIMHGIGIYGGPAVYGHEGAGVVEKVGKLVKKVSVGDHVVMCVNSHCGTCPECIKGHPMNCHEYDFTKPQMREDKSPTMLDEEGNPLLHGGATSFTTHVITTEKSVIKINKSVSLDVAGVFACGIQTGYGTVVHAANPEVGDSIAVFGVGSVGLCSILAAKHRRCYPIIAVDINPDKLAVAKELGATHCINSLEENPEEKIRELTGRGVTFAIDTVGKPEVTPSIIRSTDLTGTTLLIGASPEPMSIPTTDILWGRTVKGVVEGDSIPDLFVPDLIRMYEEGDLPLEKLFTFYDFEDINQAIMEFHQGKSIKPIVRIGE